jgi:hypothetical protein
MTGYQRRRLELFGDLLFVDATFVNVAERFQLYMPCILNQNKKILRVCYAVVEAETIPSIQFVLKSMREMCTRWVPETLLMDAKFAASTIRQVIPEASVHYCTWHWLELEVPSRFRALSNLKEFKNDLYNLRNCRDEQEFERLWDEFKVAHPSAVSYVQVWYEKRQCWVHAWTYQSTTLGYHASSPAESCNASFKAWMSQSEATLLSLLETRCVDYGCAWVRQFYLFSPNQSGVDHKIINHVRFYF